MQLAGEFGGTPIKGFTPQDSTRIKISGGGENYVHGFGDYSSYELYYDDFKDIDIDDFNLYINGIKVRLNEYKQTLDKFATLIEEDEKHN